MFSNEDFQTWGKTNAVLFAAVMTKIEGREHDELLRTYEFRGFPSMALLDAEGGMITKKISRNLYSMANVVAAAPNYVKLKGQVDAGKSVNAADWFIARLGMGELDFDAATEEMSGLKLSNKQEEAAQQQLFVMEMDQLAREARGRRRPGNDDGDAKTTASDAVYAAFKAGKRLPPGSSPTAFVDDMLVDAAVKKSDSAAFFYSWGRVQAGLEASIIAAEERLPRYTADLEKYKDNEQILPRVQNAIDRTKQSITDTKQRLVELAAAAAKLKK